MSSEVDICNLALGFIGEDAIRSIAPPDGSVAAAYCARFYPLARNTLLSMHNWAFATISGKPLAVSPVTPPPQWQFAYAAPSDMLKVTAVKPPELTLPVEWYTDTNITIQTPLADQSSDYALEANPDDGTPIIYTNVETASIYYVRLVTDAGVFSPLFVRGCARLLAADLAGPIIKGKTGIEVAEGQLKMFASMDFAMAGRVDANQQQSGLRANHVPASIAARA